MTRAYVVWGILSIGFMVCCLVYLIGLLVG